MESRISLALASKMRLLFQKDDKFLTFPLGMGFTYRYLNFMKDPSVSGLTPPEHLNNRADFARVVNVIPEDRALFPQEASRFLWDEVQAVLTEATVAESLLTDVQRTLLAQAVDFLTDPMKLEDGSELRVNSTAFNAYLHYKKIFDTADWTYVDAKTTVESSTGPEGEALRRQWPDHEKRLLAERDQAEGDWKNLGFREQVRHFQAVRDNLEPKQFPGVYKKAYLDELEVARVPDLNSMGLEFCTTFYSPFDAFEASVPWTRINLTREEIATLVQNAPADLKGVFNPGEGSDAIERVSLECTNVVIVRPWHKPEFFASRYWTLPDLRVVSDGSTPRAGRIPAYVSSMLVARNMTITRRKGVDAPPLIVPILTAKPIVTLKVADITPRLRVQPAKAPIAARPNFVPAAAVLGPVGARVAMADPRPAVVMKRNANYTAAKYAKMAIPSPKPPVLGVIDPPPAAAGGGSALVTEPYTFDGVVVLAYVCKRVPKCPDPDPGLKWS